MKNSIKISRIIVITLCELLVLYTIIMLFNEKNYDRSVLAFVTIIMIFIPEIFERVFRCRMNNVFYILTVLYTVGPMLGHCCNLYYLVSWWDKALHIYGGVLFALVGIFIFERLCKDSKSKALVVIFSVCFSMGISVIWEFFEFGADMLLGDDMMDDVVITDINSYLLGDSVGEIGSVNDITAVEINGTPLPINGYIDIGLIDTMMDMLLETLGAVIAVLVCYIPKKQINFIKTKHP